MDDATNPAASAGGGPDAATDGTGTAEVTGAAEMTGAAEVIGAAEQRLLKKLRTRSLSVREARAVLVENGMTGPDADALVGRFVHRGYLDDRALAEQLVHSAVERKGQDRMVIARTLATRGIPRDVIDAALAEMPDDDAERALDFARHKARSMHGLERDVALRRLVGQLTRRGYGSAALDAARQALDEL
ncbi:regulatory protein RecX [Microbacterium luticocti]|uniref:regulatory protein RecX n=1 Tax=Microbacterium luticocti TaxID=451764 RepID=UPI0003FE9B11|nr:regulatory protein RecX [Microbacterium luticocti]